MRSQAIMSRVSMAVANRLAYKDMNTVLYLGITITLYCLIVLFSQLLPSDIGSVLDLVSAYAISCAAFFIPSLFYMKALRKFKLKSEDDPTVKTNMLLAKCFIGFGVFNAIMSVTSAFFAIFGVE